MGKHGEHSRLILDPVTIRAQSAYRSKLSAPLTSSDYNTRWGSGAATTTGRRGGEAWEVGGSGDESKSFWLRLGCCVSPVAIVALVVVGSLGVKYAGGFSGGHGVVTGDSTRGSFENENDASLRTNVDAASVGKDPTKTSSSSSFWTLKNGWSTSSESGGETPKVFSGRDSVAHPLVEFDAGRTTGVALHGWLELEEWFFSQGSSHGVSARAADENGVCFPPMYPDAKSLGFSWASEGDLVNKLVKSVGAKAAVHSFTAHRAQYVTDEDLLKIASEGIEIVRLPLSWSLFARDPSTVPRGGERILVDPVYPDRLFVNMAGADLDAVVERIRNAGLKVLLSLHNMPGGAAVGTYNGVFPHPPMMFAREELRNTGLAVVRNFLTWFKNLPEDSRSVVHGIQLLNEPGHSIPNMRTKVLGWLENAVQIYKDEIVNEGVSSNERVPFLYVNLIETLGLNVADMAAWMRSQFTVKELQSWVVLDVHHYFAWSYTGCLGGSNAGCEFDCDDKPSVVAQHIGEAAGEWAGTLRAAAQIYGVQNIAVSEWSLATFSDSSKSCKSREVLDIMYENQERAYRGAGIQGFFWGWKMPHGGSHIKAWSLSDYLAGSEDKEMRQHAIIPHGFDLDDASEMVSPESEKSDADRLIRAYSQFADESSNGGDVLSSSSSSKKGMMAIDDVLKLLNAARASAAIGDSMVDVPRPVETRKPRSSKPADIDSFSRASSKLRKMIDVDEYDDEAEDAAHEIMTVEPTKRPSQQSGSSERPERDQDASLAQPDQAVQGGDAKTDAAAVSDVASMLADIPLSSPHTLEITAGGGSA